MQLSTRVIFSEPDAKQGTFPGENMVVADMLKATAAAAIVASQNIYSFTKGKPEAYPLKKDEKNRRVKILDIDSHNAFEASLHTSSCRYRGQDAEGAKEAAEHKLGEAMPLANGKYGNGKKEAIFVVDVIEGTTKAAHGHNNAISIVAASENGGITKIPNDATYVRKLFAPPAYKNILSMHNSVSKNLEAIMATEYVSKPEHITVAVMDRKCNTTIINEAQKFGAKVQLISAGDLIWGFKAMVSPPHHPILMLGRGGASEGSITMVMAKALDATGQIRIIEENNDIEVIDRTHVWDAKTFVPGKHPVCVFSAITENDEVYLPALEVDKKRKQATVHSIVITQHGLHKINSIYPLPKYRLNH